MSILVLGLLVGGICAIGFLVYKFLHDPVRNARLHFRKALIWEQLKDFDRAIEEYKKVLPFTDNPEIIHFRIGQLCMLKNEYSQALKEFEKAYEKKENFKEAYFAKLDILLRTQEVEKAKEFLDTLKKKFPDDTTLFLYAVKIAISEGRIDDAKQDLAHLLWKDPGNVVARVISAQLALKESNWVDAKINARAAIKFSDDRLPAAHLLLSEIYAKTEDFSKAIIHLNKWIEANPKDIYARLNLAELYIKNLDYAGAINILRKVLKEDPTNPQAHAILGRALFLNKDIVNAKEHLRYAAKHLPPNAIIFTQLGNCYEFLGKWKKALKYYKKALLLNPNLDRVRIAIAEIYLNHGMPNQAIPHYQKLLEKEPENVSILNMLSIAYINIKEYRKAEEVIQKITEILPTFYKEAYLAIIKLNEGDIEGSIKICKQFLKNNPTDINIRNLLGITYLNAGKLEEAKKQFLEIKKIHYRAPTAYLNLAFIYKRQGNLRAAIKEYRDILKIYPQLFQARLGLGNIYLSINKPQLALKEFNLTLEDNPGNKQALVGKIQASIILKKYPIVIKLCKEILQTDSKNAIIWGYLGNAYRNSYQLEKAEECYRKCLELNPRITFGYELASLYFYQHKYVEAIQLYKKMLKINSKYVLALKKLSILYYQLNRPNISLTYINKAFRITKKKTVEDLLLKLIYTVKSKENIEPIKQEIEKLYPVYTYSVFQLISSKTLPIKIFRLLTQNIYYTLSTWDEEAANIGEKIIKEFPEYTFPYYILGQTYLRLEKKKATVELYKKGTTLNPKDPLLHLSLGNVYLLMKQKKSALKEFKETIQLFPDGLEIKLRTAILAQQLGKYATAEMLYLDLLKRNFSPITVTNNLANLYLIKKDYEKALKYARDILDKIQDKGNPIVNAVIYDTVGWIYYKIKDYEKAYEILSTATEMNPKDPMINFHLGMVLYKMGLLTESQIHMEKTLQQNPTHVGARHMLQKIQQRFQKELLLKQ